LAVHSLKDLPVEDSPGLTVVAIPERAAAGDMLISSKATAVEDLPRNAVVGTSSLRRAAQILAIRPDVRIKDIRGNIDTRLRKVTEAGLGYEATLLAQAGLERLGYTALPYAHPIPYRVMLPAPGQGALAVQGRAADTEINIYLLALDHAPTRAAVTAERAFLAGLGGGCSLPVGALAQVTEEYLTLEALVAAPDGQRLIRVNGQSSSTLAEELGQNLAHEALQKGAKQLLATIG
jgi:hydroxymethylbilane synthase